MGEDGEAIKRLLMRIIIFPVVIVFSLFFLDSCKPPEGLRHAVYFSDSLTEAEKVIGINPVVIKPGDRLSINITAINKEAAEAFNTSATASAGAGQPSTAGYLVDTFGNIQLLQLGVIHVGGMTTFKLRDSLQQQLINYIKGPLVTVSITNFQVNIMGEVTKPGAIIVPDGKMNILQAITQAGDITQFGIRQNILVIRETNGKREFGRIDISSNHVFESPFFYLQQNDVVYVEPDKAKFNDVVITRNLRNISIGTSILTIILLIVSLTKK